MIDWPIINSALKQWLIGMLLVLGWFLVTNFTCAAGGCNDATASNMSLIGLGGITFIGARAAHSLMRADTQLLFTPLVAYAAASALFFGFGPMSSFLASDATLRFLANSIYATTPEEVLRTGLLSSSGIAISLIAIVLLLPRYAKAVRYRPVINLRKVTMILLITGLALNHLVIMPSVYGTLKFSVPGMIGNLRYLPDIGFALVAMLAAQGSNRWKLLFWMIWPWHLLLAFPEFSKKAVMLTIIMPAIGAFIGHRSFRRLALWIVAAMLLFASLQNINAISRWAASDAQEHSEVLTLRDRFQILLASGISTTNVDDLLPEAQIGVETWWLRLNYSGPQAAAMELYDSGNTSTFTTNILVYLVPRILWPDNPPLPSPGQAFNAIVSGNPDNQTKVGVTVFADGYWQFGWFGVFLWSACVGVIFAVMTRMTLMQLGAGRYLYLPAAILGVQMGATSMTAFFQNGFLAGLPVYFAYCFVVYLLYRILGDIGKAQALRRGAPPPRVAA
ncbi:hypothetical protein SAMN05877809_102523 [Rhodobacter sp. JA431]|uniref:hypothetical protein n=1 Tax=Rhodobacter sp. JA431 TaxID=570013 RepID=UPI000BC886A1|nr:hypothetical protein [Rhodobacter sp. JA431]SOB99887.1 hypothetical protein SAMN05877809_102523 [Rhodobacter sp. JA431]